MKKIFISPLLILFIIHVGAQSPTLKWAKGSGGVADDFGKAIAVDKQGNVYTAGYFSGTADFNPSPSGKLNLSAAGEEDIFISKLDASGNLIWAKTIGGPSHDLCTSMTLDAVGNIYLCGSFYKTVDFDPSPAGKFNLSSDGAADIFILKLDSSGKFLWVRKMGGSAMDYGLSVAVDASGNVYSSGSFKETANFDPGEKKFNLDAEGNEDIFISKLTATGNFIWAKKIGGPLADELFSMAIDKTGKVYLTGSFRGTVDFDPGTTVFNLKPAGYDDIFVCKLDASGSFIWARGMGGTAGAGTGYAVAADESGNVFITGGFIGKVDFDPSGGVFNMTSTAGNFDAFILKLNSSGNLQWAKKAGGILDDIGHALALDASGNLYVLGVFSGTANLGGPSLSATGGVDIFMLEINTAGSFLWTKKLGGSGYEDGICIAIDKPGNIYTTGNFSGMGIFDSQGKGNLNSAGKADAFICVFRR